MALAMREEVARHTVEQLGALRMRFGMHTGPVVAGVISKRATQISSGLMPSSKVFSKRVVHFVLALSKQGEAKL